MINSKYISLGEILWRVMKNPLMEELDYDEAATHAIDVLKLLGAPLLYGEKIETLQVKDYRAYLPQNLLNLRGIKYKNIPLRYATDTFHSKQDENLNSCNNFKEFTYILNNCAITTSFEEGEIEVAYTYIVVDDEGYPMIPDNISVIKAVEYHIQTLHLEAYWMMGKISDKAFQYIQQQRAWYIGQAQSSTLLQGVDQLESIINGLNRLIINDDAYQNFYKGFGIKERIKRFS